MHPNFGVKDVLSSCGPLIPLSPVYCILYTVYATQDPCHPGVLNSLRFLEDNYFYYNISIVNIYWYLVCMSLAKPLVHGERAGWLSTEIIHAGDPVVTWLGWEWEMLWSQEWGKQRVHFWSRIEQSIIVVSSERFRENYAEISAVAIKQAFTALQGGHRDFLDAVSYIVMLWCSYMYYSVCDVKGDEVLEGLSEIPPLKQGGIQLVILYCQRWG